METIKWEELFIEYLENHPVDDKSHDIGHFKRVWKTAQKLLTPEADQLIVLAAAYFHDIVSYPKNHPNRSLSSVHAANKTEEILLEMDFPKDKIQSVKHCIEAHSFSSNIAPETLEAKIIQDADRMEALGAIGLARTFYIAGRLGSKLFHEDDPMAINRDLDDST